MHARHAALAGGQPARIDWPRTLIARGAERLLRPEHLRPGRRQPRWAALHCFVLDCSGSMLGDGRLARAKGVLAALLGQAYRRRDRVAVVSFGGTGTRIHLSPRRAAMAAPDWLAPIGGGGGTPLTAALAQADALLARHAGGPRWLWLLTDGYTRETPPRPRHAAHVRVIDFETARVPLGRAPALAACWDAACVRADAWWG